MKNRTTVVLYWGSTGLLAFLMAALSFAYFALPYFAAGFKHTGFPDYFRVVLGIAKGLGAVALVIKLPDRLKEFVYDGFAIMFVCGVIAHLSSGDPPATALGALFALSLLSVSWVMRRRVAKERARAWLGQSADQLTGTATPAV